MKPSLRLLAGVLLCSTLLAGSLAAQGRIDRSQECVICHISWDDEYKALEPTLPPTECRLLIEGLESRVSSEDMCWSCHDGYVVDSRLSFLEHEPHMTAPQEGDPVGDLPLDLDGRIYCGSCHTPHTRAMASAVSYEPFLREEVRGSTLCMSCHSDHGDEFFNHPLHVRMDQTVVLEAGFHSVPADTVECLSCHRMHRGEKALRVPAGEPTATLCMTCHTDQQELLFSDHDFSQSDTPELPRLAETGGDACLVCHAMHEAAGPDLWPTALQPAGDGEDARCLTCHQLDGPATGFDHWGHPLGVRQEVLAQAAGLPLDGGRVTCLSCHDPHRWSLDHSQLADGDEDGNPSTSFLRLPDQADQGLCMACHTEQAPVLDSPHGPAEGLFVRSGDQEAWRCSNCHTSHGPAPYTVGKTASAPSAASALCLSCHLSGEEGHGELQGLGRHSHSIGVLLTEEMELPGTLVGPPAPRDEELLLACEHCHDPHRWSPMDHAWKAGLELPGEAAFIKEDNREGALCLRCHHEQAAIQGSLHSEAGKGACAQCHQPHRAATDQLILQALLPSDPDSLLQAASWLAGSREMDPAQWSRDNRQCLICHHDENGSQRVPRAWAHPEFPDSLRALVESAGLSSLRVQCSECHDPHMGSGPEGPHDRSVAFLKKTSQDQVCALCHRDQALWKYQFFHDPHRRQR